MLAHSSWAVLGALATVAAPPAAYIFGIPLLLISAALCGACPGQTKRLS